MNSIQKFICFKIILAFIDARKIKNSIYNFKINYSIYLCIALDNILV